MIIDLTTQEIEIPEPSAPYALIAITKHGCALAEKIGEKIKVVDIYCPEKFKDIFHYTDNELRVYSGRVKILLENIFEKYEGIIAIVSIGALVRLVSPLLTDKTNDPGVVVLDEKGKFVVSLLSGHVGGGNELCRFVAEKINAIPVITTSSDVRETISIDIMGKPFGWYREPCDDLTEISAAVVNDEPVVIVQESGETDWIPESLPQNLKIFHTLDEAQNFKAEYFIIITHRDMSSYKFLDAKKVLVYRPKVIALGIGCNRGTAEFEIEKVAFETMDELKIVRESVHGIASIDLKQDEAGLIEFAKKFSWNILFYPANDLNTVTVTSPSETVFKYTGAYGVSEPAAKLYSKNDELMLVKKVSGNVTVSVGMMKSNNN
jgi:cobalt-precorrin 5A hydrolase